MFSTRQKMIGISLLSLTLGFLLLFTIGEVLSGDISGLSHLLQIVPILLLLILSFKKPKIAGFLLTSSSLTLGLLYPFRASFNLQAIIIVEIILFLPLVLSGIFFMLSAKNDKKLATPSSI